MVRSGPPGGPGPPALPPVRFSPWQSRQARIETRYRPYSAETPSAGATTGWVMGGWALVLATPDPTRRAARTFNLVAGFLGATAAWARRYATIASTSWSLRL